MAPACVAHSNLPTNSDSIQLKRQVLAAFDIALGHVADGVGQLNNTRQMLSRLNFAQLRSLDSSNTSAQIELDSADSGPSPAAFLRLQNEVLSQKVEIEAMRLSYDAMINSLRTQLQSANAARLVAEANLQRLRSAVRQTESSIQLSLTDLGRVTFESGSRLPIDDAGGDMVIAQESADGVIPPDTIRAISKEQIPKQPFDSHRFYQLLVMKTVTPAALAGQIADVLSQKTLPMDEVNKAFLNVIVDGNHDCKFIAQVLANDVLDKVRDLIVIGLFEKIVSAPDCRSPSIRSLADAVSIICVYSSQIEALRVLLFDLLRLRSVFEVEIFAVVFAAAPNILVSLDSSPLCHAITAIVCEALETLPERHSAKCDILSNAFWKRSYKEYEPGWFAAIVPPAIDALLSPDTDQVLDGMRALELIALARGWPWTCSNIVDPVWRGIMTCSAPDQLARMITTVAVVGRTSSTDPSSSSDGGFFQAMTTRLRSFLDKAFPDKVQIAAVNALILLSNGRLSFVQDVYKWFVTVPETIRTLIPESLREDIKFIGKQLSVR